MKRPTTFLERQARDLGSDERNLSRRKVLGMLSAVGAGMALAPRVVRSECWGRASHY